jgi:hypothetical protein
MRLAPAAARRDRACRTGGRHQRGGGRVMTDAAFLEPSLHTANDVPTNPLHARGYPSIGCAPCTRAIEPGEDIRAGRWWWEHPGHRECGLHRRPLDVVVRAEPALSS